MTPQCSRKVSSAEQALESIAPGLPKVIELDIQTVSPPDRVAANLAERQRIDAGHCRTRQHLRRPFSGAAQDDSGLSLAEQRQVDPPAGGLDQLGPCRRVSAETEPARDCP